MNSKTILVVVSCLVAVANARPASAPSADGCSLGCTGRNFWTGYKAGTTLKYTFEQKAEVSYSLSQQKAVLLLASGTASVEVHSDCEMVLTVNLQATKTSKSPGESASLEDRPLPKALSDGLQQPLRFSFEDGRIKSLCPGAGESRASLNFKRGLLSQLHLSIDKPGQDINVREEDVLGSCWTAYKSLGGNKVEKTKDLASCISNFEVFPRRGVKFESPEQVDPRWQTVVQGNLKCTIELETDSAVIKENLCVEERLMENNLGEQGVGETVKVTTGLKLQQKLGSLASALFAVKERSDLLHRHKTAAKCHDAAAWLSEDPFYTGNECLEKKAPETGATSSVEFSTAAKQVIQQLCTETLAGNMLNTTAAKYADLIKYLRGITSQEDFNGFYSYALKYASEGCGASNELLKTVVNSAVASTGTRQSVQLILTQLKGSDGMSSDSSPANWLIDGVAMMPHPTPEIIKDVLEYTKKTKEDSLAIISKDQPLVLAAVTGRYCTENPGCEADGAVTEVLNYFSEALGVNCSKLEVQDDQGVFDYAFAVLLSTGNVGRAAGGASAIIGCAENAKLSLANRVFALQALRRFPALSGAEKLRVGEIIANKSLDSELRITAYQVVARYATLSFWSDERAVKRLQDVLQDEREDQQLQRYVYSHLSQWIRKQKRSTDSFTVSNVLREYEKVIADSKLTGMQVSGYWNWGYKNPSTKSKAELESNIVYSSKSIMPRLVNFNFSVETPLSAEAINMFELGLRLEGMESMIEQVFNVLNKDSKEEDELVRKRRQVAAPELTDEQKQYKQTATKQRLDVFIRKNGMELTHNNFDETILGVFPQFMKTLDLENVKGLIGEKLSSINVDTVSHSAGTPVETTVSVPTIAGFAILLKKEMHYLTNLGLKQSFEVPSDTEAKLQVEVRPTVSVYMARTVLVDSGFERAGVKSQTSGLSSMGVKVSLEGKFKDNEVLFSAKFDPLKKLQTILEVKTDVVFVQHTQARRVGESPVLSPAEVTPITRKCFTTASVKLFGRRMCLETNFERTYNPLAAVRQNPGSFRLFVEKDDSFGYYEATIQAKVEGRNLKFLAVLGDQKSADRHAKILFSLERTDKSRKITLELANPVLPIKWESESKDRAGGGSDVTVGLKFGSTDYAFKGVRSKDEEGNWKLDGDFYRKDKERQKLGIATKFAFYGFLKYLPLIRFDVTATTPTNDKLTFNHLINYDYKNKFEFSVLASHEKSGSVVTSVKSRLQYNSVQRDAAGQTRTLLYDTEVLNKNGKNFQHSFSAKVDRKKKGGAADTWESSLAVSHKFKHGVTKEKSVIDMDAAFKLVEVIRPGRLYMATGSGNINYGADSERKPVKLSNLRVVLGNSDEFDAHVDATTVLLSYDASVEGVRATATLAVHVLPITKWRVDNQCVMIALEAIRTEGPKTKRHFLELVHNSSRDDQFGAANVPSISQVLNMVYANEVLLAAAHRFYPTAISSSGGAAGLTFRHFINVTTFDARNFFIENRYSAEISQKITLKVSTDVTVNRERRIQLNHTLAIDVTLPRVDYKLVCTRAGSVGSFRIYWQDSGFAERRRNAAEIGSYLSRARTEGFNLRRFVGLVQQFTDNIKMESGLEMVGPEMKIVVTNYMDMSTMDGVLLNFTRTLTYGNTPLQRSLVIFKRLEKSQSLYSRFYKARLNIEGVESEYRTEVVYVKSANPKMTISLAKVAISGPQGPDYSASAVGQFFPRHQRDGQVALHINTTWQGDGVKAASSLRVVVDTAPWKYLNPAFNLTQEVVATGGEIFTLTYGLGLQKAELVPRPSTRNIKAVTSDLNIVSTFRTSPFRYRGVTTYSSSLEEPFNFVFRKQLNNNDIINFRTTLSSGMLYIGASSDILPAKEVSYQAQYKLEADSFISYLSEVKLNVLQWDVSVQDKGKFKVTGRGANRVLFSTVYSGSFSFRGFDNLIPGAGSIDKLDYSGLLEAKDSGEFDTFFKVDKVKGSSSENVGFLSSKFNIWPFEISSQIKTPLWGIDHYGFNISAGRQSQGNDYWAKAWVASPGKRSTLTLAHSCRTPARAEMTASATLQSDHLFRLATDTIDSSLIVRGSSIFDYTFFMNISTPYKQLELLQLDASQNDKKQTMAITMKMNDEKTKVFNYEGNMAKNSDGTNVGSMSFFFAPGIVGFRNFSYDSQLVTGRDYLYGLEVTLNNEKLAVADLLWLKSGNTYPHLSRLSIPGANFGFDLSGFVAGAKTFQFYLLRSGNDVKSQWQMKYKGTVEVETKAEVNNGRLTSGSGTAFGKSITFTSPSEGVIEVKAASSGGKDSITYSSQMGGDALQNMNMKFSISGKESCLSYSKQAIQVNVGYGSCAKPNTIKVTCQSSNIWDMKKAKFQISVEHTTDSDNKEFYLLPELIVPLITTDWPFQFSMDVNNEQRQGKINFDSTKLATKFAQEYDMSKFPSAMTYKRTMSVRSGPMKTEQSLKFNYDWNARTVDIQADAPEYKLRINNQELSIELPGIFTAGVKQFAEQSTGKMGYEFKGEWRPAAGSQPCILRLWKQNTVAGTRLALEFVAHSGKDINIVTDVTNFEYTPVEFKMNVETTLSSTLIEQFRSAKSTMFISVNRNAPNRNYTIVYKESFTASGVLYYELDSVFKGRDGMFPSTMKIAFPKGYIESEFSYNFNPAYTDESYIVWSLSKFGEKRDSYLIQYRTKDVSDHVGKFWRDFSLEVSSPRRQIFLSESCKVLANGTVQTELQAFINKRNSEGFVAVLSKDFTTANVYKRSLRLTLPTRQVGYDRILTIDGNKLNYDITIYWDIQTALDKKIVIQFNREKSWQDGYYYFHRLDLSAPFLKNKVSKEMLIRCKENQFTFSVSHAQGTDDKVALVFTGLQTWNARRTAFQKEMNISFTQQKGDVKANVRITLDVSQITGPRPYTSSPLVRVLNVYTTVPSLSVDSHVRIRYVPKEEFTYACNHGATFSFRYYKGYKRSRLFLFVSNSKKEAGQLTMVRDWLMSTWDATLDTGKGYMDPKSTIGFPIYEPTKVLVKASAGLSSNRKKLHFGVVSGEMTVKSSVNLWKPDTVPNNLDFFFVGVKVNKDDNTLDYASHWRIRRTTVKSPYTYLKEVLVDPWVKAQNLPFGTDTINKLWTPVARSRTSNINTDEVLDMLTSFSSNDIDSLSRWAAKARENNEFLLNTIGANVAYLFQSARQALGYWASSLGSVSYGNLLPTDFGIMRGISAVIDSLTSALNNIPITRIWSTTLTVIRMGSDQIRNYFSAYIDRVGSGLRDRISTLTGGRGSSLPDMIYAAVSSVYPVGKAWEKLMIIVDVSTSSLWSADVELATQIGNALQPFVISTLAEIPKVYDFLDNLNYEINQWSVYLNSLIQAYYSDKVGAIQTEVIGKAAYSRNLLTSLGLLLMGDYSGGIKQFFNTDANEVRVWRLTCDQACLDSGSFAAINGTVYLPFDLSSVDFVFPRERLQSADDALRSYRIGRKSSQQKLTDAFKELQSERGLGGVIKRLVSPKHRTAEAAGNYISTFGGTQLRNLSPCRYLLAHDFLNGDFSVYQTYTWEGRSRKRGDLLVRFFKAKVTISNSNQVSVDGTSVSSPVFSRKVDDQTTVEGKASGDKATVKFHSEGLQNALEVKCRRSTDSCSVRVHPLYHGRINGAFGSNDGNAANDLHANSGSEHMRLWVTDSCIQS